jgi:protein involved in polysaccharide export with SLBB domain
MRHFVVSVALLAGFIGPLSAQQTPVDVRKPQASRAELTAALANLEQVMSSTAYSKSLRKAKEAEAALVRVRLEEGDFQVGDQIDVVVVGEQALSTKFTVLQDRVLSFPQLAPISLKGVLRSEVRDYLTQEIGKYIKNPQVTVQGSFIRLAIMGAVGKPGYYSVPADNLVSDAIMLAGGPQGTPQMEKSVVRRNGREVVPEGELERAIQAGQSLDQLNLHGGDELVLVSKGGTGPGSGPGQGGGGIQRWIWPLQTAVSLAFVLSRIL